MLFQMRMFDSTSHGMNEALNGGYSVIRLGGWY
jgi:hypothetical protein